MMATDPEKSRQRSAESIEYQPPQSQDPTGEPESGEPSVSVATRKLTLRLRKVRCSWTET